MRGHHSGLRLNVINQAAPLHPRGSCRPNPSAKVSLVGEILAADQRTESRIREVKGSMSQHNVADTSAGAP